MRTANEAVSPPPAVAPAGGDSTSLDGHATFSYAKSGAFNKAEDFSSKSVMFLGDCGQKFCHKGKVGRVLKMLATYPDGITQYSTYPWHTRLAASIKILRDSGLTIQTEREGDNRHARYHLQTAGSIINQPQSKERGQ